MLPNPDISHSIALRLVKRRFGDTSMSIQDKISSLDDKKLDEFISEFLDFDSENELEAWLDKL